MTPPILLDYRQNPSKIYNGVRHQTSMCKAFVKLPRPYGDQSGGARKWAIRAGCENWFTGGGYHPPGSTSPVPTSAKAPLTKTTKAKTTARSKQLAIGTGHSSVGMISPQARRAVVMDSNQWSSGPSSGPAFDGTNKPFNPYSHSSYPMQHQYMNHPYHYQQQQQMYLPPGYHYAPIPTNQQYNHQHQAPTQYVPAWYNNNGHPVQAASPEEYEHGLKMEGMGVSVGGHGSSERDSPYEQDERVVSPGSGHGSLSPSEGH
jgi:hypothetical protein